jgi:hypothetical protein
LIGALALVSAAYAVLLFVTGGFDTEVFGLRLRSRAWERPAALAFLLSLIAFSLAARRALDRGESAWARMDSASTARWLTALAIAWALFAGFRYGSFAAGGADSFGYVSQAQLFARGALTDDVPMRPEFTWRDAPVSLIPLAYRPAAQPGRMAPVYPPGLPLLMSALQPLGDAAMYALVPVLGAVVLLCVAATGRRLGDQLAGAVAAVCLSVSATFLLMQFSPMSDVPVTAMWLGSMLCASATWRGSHGLAGALAGAAVLTRPNLAPLAVFVGVLVMARPHSRVRSLVAFSLPLVAGVIALLWIQWRRYGDPFLSGYGAAGELFALAHVVPNLASYAARITAIYTPLVWLWLAGPALATRVPSRALLWTVLLVIAAVWLAYLPYLPFGAWFFTRFLLPAIPLMLVLAVAVMMAGVRRLPLWLRPAVTVALVVCFASVLAGESRRRAVFESATLEQKYPDAGRYVRDHLVANSYVLAGQHSGSVRLYSGRPTIRWDVVGGDQLDTVIRTVRETGAQIYVVADDDELPAFASHFGGQSAVQRLRRLAQFGQAGVYAVE